MKRLSLFIAFTLAFAMNTMAQDSSRFVMQTLSSPSSVGGYGSLNTNVTSFRDMGMVSMGINGACILNHSFAIGIEGYGVLPSIDLDDFNTPDTTRETRLTGGWGGLHMEGIFNPGKAIHLVVPVSFGAGWLGYIANHDNNYNNYPNDNYNNVLDDTFFWYIEPGAGVELNIASFFRLYVGATYKFTTNIDLRNAAENELQNINGRVLLKFGKF